VEAIDAESIYDVPLLMAREKLDERVLNKLKISSRQKPDLNDWKKFLGRLKNPLEEVEMALVGKYVELKDSYKSIAEALIHAGASLEVRVKIRWIRAEELLEPHLMEEHLKGVQGILVAPGFGERGIEGKINAVQFARENNIPFFGICLGMQCAVVEFARHVLSLRDAASSEMNPATQHPVIDLLEEQKQISQKGGTMRLGAWPCQVKKGSQAWLAYNSTKITERHRHRYEFNSAYLPAFESAGMLATGTNPGSGLVEIVELPAHPWFVGVQFHPELKSTVDQPHPLFMDFVKAMQNNKNGISVARKIRQKEASL
jgi:CTP synthase